MKIAVLGIFMCLTAAYGGYIYGKSQAHVEIIEKKVEVIKYVARKRAQIHAQPNADRAELLKLMRAGIL